MELEDKNRYWIENYLDNTIKRMKKSIELFIILSIEDTFTTAKEASNTIQSSS
jgi:hypothetical protein